MRRFTKLRNGKYVDVNTGEVFSYDFVISLLQSEKKTVTDLVDSELTEIRKENGVLTKKDTHHMNWNNESGNPKLFTKSYKVLQRELIRIMNVNEMALVFIFSSHLETETNRIIYDGGKDITNEYLAKMMKKSTRSVINTINSLEQKDIIAKVSSGRGRKLYLNPHIAFDGKHISKETLEIFNIV